MKFGSQWLAVKGYQGVLSRSMPVSPKLGRSTFPLSSLPSFGSFGQFTSLHSRISSNPQQTTFPKQLEDILTPQHRNLAGRVVRSVGMESTKSRIEVDGSILEGGGQILRNAAALAALTGQDVQIDKIRAGRKKPGLAAQHLTGLQLVAEICQGRLEGGKVGSTCVELAPGGWPLAGRYQADTKTAGSCTLMVQAALPLMMYAAPRPGAGTLVLTELDLKGGTDADFAPPVDYLKHVLAPTLRRLYGINLEVDCVKRGFYPRGGGHVRVKVQALAAGHRLTAVDLTNRGKVTHVRLYVYSAGSVPKTAAQRMASACTAELRTAARLKARDVVISHEIVEETKDTALGDGIGMLAVAETDSGCIFGASRRGERGVSAEAIGAQVASELADVLNSGACVDEWMQDQLMIFFALAQPGSRMLCSEPSLHSRTAMVIAEQLLPGVEFTITPQQHPSQAQLEDGGLGQDAAMPTKHASTGLWLVECAGASFTYNH